MDKPIGKVTHYYDKIGVAVVDLISGSLKVGDQIKFKKGDEEFAQPVTSLQVEHKAVEEVKAGDAFGLKVDQLVEEGAEVFKA
ncbi:MAG: EF-Tu/IF-2/RF-3 family GTPase [Candidatus Daviesbacteria bacterium]